MKLYHAPTSVCSQKVRVGMAEIGLDYESVVLDLQAGDQFDSAYRKLNPDAVVPTLVEDGLIVVESSLILEYLDETHNASRLMPDDAEARVRAKHWLLRCVAVHAAINALSFSTAMRDRIRATQTPEEFAALVANMPDPVMGMKRRDLIDNGLESVFVQQALIHLGRTFADMDAALAECDWVTGPAFGIADIALVSYLDRLDRLGFAGLWADRPRIGDWLAAMQARPSYATGIADHIPASQAAKMKADGEKHWPRLEAIWTGTIVDRAE